VNEDVRRADRAASAILAEYGPPTTIDFAHTLLCVAYLQGGRDELQRIVDEADETKERLLRALEGTYGATERQS
jgi:hypothetical protein